MPSAYRAAKPEPSGQHPTLTVKSTTNKMVTLLSMRSFYASATTGTVYRVSIGRYNGGGITPTDRTEKTNTRSRAAGSPGQTWSTPPTLVGNLLVFQDAGERTQFRNTWRPGRPGAEIFAIDAEELGSDISTGASNSDNHGLGWIEDFPRQSERRQNRRSRGRGFFHFMAYFNNGGSPITTKGSQNRQIYGVRRQNAARMLTEQSDFNTTLRGGGGTTFSQSMAATLTLLAAMQRTTNKNMLATVTTTASMVKQVVKNMLATVTLTPAMTKVTQKSMAATVTMVAALARSVVYARALLATVTMTASMSKTVNKSMLATVTLVASMVKTVQKALLATVTLTASMVKQVQKSLVASVTLVASMVRAVTKAVNMLATVTAQASMSKTVNKSMAATVTLSAAMSRVVNKTLAASVNVTASMSKTVQKSLLASVNAVASMSKVVNKALAASVSLVASIGRAFQPGGTLYNQAMLAVVTVQASMTPVKHLKAAAAKLRTIIMSRFGQW